MNLKGKYFKREYKDSYIIVRGLSDIVSPSFNATTPCEIVFEEIPWGGKSMVGSKSMFMINMLIPITEEEAMLEVL